MKPASNLHRLPATDSWQRQPQVKNALIQRIKSITSEIHSIQAEMHGQLDEPASGSRLARFFDDENAVQTLNDFKAELDQLRRILWFYIEQATAQPAAAMNKEQQDKRLQRVNELLRALAPSPAAPASAEQTIQPSISFFERLDVVIDTYMQEKKPVAQAKAAKAGY
jgi:vacuolar-type H+-ATPase subunit I/STV1